jgi:CheY-like chemotaxis protein
MSFSSPLAPIVLVDDDPDALYYLHRQFDRLGICNPIVTFVDAEDALTFLDETLAAHRELPAVIFTDLKMPWVDGMELLARIRRNPAFDSIRLVMISTSDEARDMARAAAVGAERYIVKYPKTEVLAAALQADSLLSVA